MRWRNCDALSNVTLFVRSTIIPGEQGKSRQQPLCISRNFFKNTGPCFPGIKFGNHFKPSTCLFDSIPIRLFKEVLPIINASVLLQISLLIGPSSAFSTVSHSILLQRLDHAIDIKGNATQWFKTNPSYRPTKQTGAGFVLVFCFYFYFFLCGQVC